MKIAPFSIEQYFMRHEFSAPYLLCTSDCESLTVGELLQLAGHTSAEVLTGLHLGYTETAGSPALRAAIAATYRDVDPEHVIVLGAPEEGIYVALRTLLDPGDEVIVLTPAYDSLRTLAIHICGAPNVKEWPLVAGATDWVLDLERLAALITPRTRLLIVNFPHNPTGYLPSREVWEQLLALAARHGLTLFSDEMYRGLELDPADRLPSLADAYPQAVVLAGLSKVHGLPGLRSGWLVVADEALRAAMINWKMYTTICPPAPSEQLALVALEAQEALIARSRALIAANLQVAAAFYRRHAARFHWRPPRAGSVALAQLRHESATAHSAAVLRKRGILLLPSPYFSFGDHHLRMGLGRRNFADNLHRYDAWLQEPAGSVAEKL